MKVLGALEDSVRGITSLRRANTVPVSEIISEYPRDHVEFFCNKLTGLSGKVFSIWNII